MSTIQKNDARVITPSAPSLWVTTGTSAFQSGTVDPAAPMSFDMLAALLAYPLYTGKLTLAEYAAFKLAKDDRAKFDKDTRWFSLASFKDGVRSNDTVVNLSGFVGDLDTGRHTLAQIQAKLAGVVHFVFATYSHSPEHPKYRVVVPYARTVNPADHAKLFAYFNTVIFDGALDVAASDPARLSYFPSCCADQQSAADFAYQHEGAYFDPAPVLASMPAAAPKAAKSVELTTAAVWPVTHADLAQAIAARVRGDARFAGQMAGREVTGDPSGDDFAFVKELLKCSGGNGQAVLDYLLNMPADCLHTLSPSKAARLDYYLPRTICHGFDELNADPAVNIALIPFGKSPKPAGCSDEPVPDADVPAGTKKRKPMPPAPEPTTEDPRPVILLSSGKLDQYATQAEQLMADAIYVRGENLVRIGRAAEILKDAAGTQRDAAQAVCIAASPGWMRRELMERAQFWKYDKRSNEWEARDCPKELAENIGDQEAWATFRPLITITPAPFLRPDMSVCAVAGYDVATGIYYQPTLVFPPIVPAPTREDALQALARLREPFAEFPYASPEAEAVFLSHVVASILRPSFDTSPIYFYTAPLAATGKTLLASMPSLIANGAAAAQHPYSEKEELRKVLFSSLLAGDTALALDNVPTGVKVRAPVLCAFATSATYTDRILGVSEQRKIPNRCSVSLTGNNITPVGDMARRSIVTRLDVNAESARGRRFRIKDLRGHVLERRAQLIVDALTIVRAYALAGHPEVAHPLESFERWSRVVRDPLVWLGMADPVTSQATETEDEVVPLQGAFEAIAAVTQTLGHMFTAAQLATLTVGFGGNGGPTLRDALIAADCAEPADATKLGYWLRENKDRVAGGWKLERRNTAHGGVANWRLRAV
jgi:hypothetical protein